MDVADTGKGWRKWPPFSGPALARGLAGTILASAAGAPSCGLAYVFFAACAGTIGLAPPESSGAAGSFPLAPATYLAWLKRVARRLP